MLLGWLIFGECRVIQAKGKAILEPFGHLPRRVEPVPAYAAANLRVYPPQCDSRHALYAVT